MKKLIDAPEDGVELELFRGLATDLYNPIVRFSFLPVACNLYTVVDSKQPNVI